MSDRELRRLEQAWRSSGSDEDELAYLQARIRNGRLERGALEVAAYLGDQVAASLLVDDGLTARPPRRGLNKFLARLPGDRAVRLLAALTACEVLAEGERASPTSSACRETVRGWLERPDERSLEAVAAACEGQAQRLEGMVRYFRRDQPPASYAYNADRHNGLEIASWLLTHYAREDDRFTWQGIAMSLGAAVGEHLETFHVKRIRAAIGAALLPWALLRAPSGEGAAPHEPRQADSPLRPEAMTDAARAAVLAAAPAGEGRPSTDEAHKVLQAYFVALGYQPYRGALTNEERTRRVKFRQRSLLLQEGRPGAWVKLAGTEGHELLLTDCAQRLLSLARRKAR